MRIHQKAMREIDDGAHLKDLKTFRWELYHFRNSKEVIRCLSRYYFKKYAFKYFSEEIVIAGYNLQDVKEHFFSRHHNKTNCNKFILAKSRYTNRSVPSYTIFII